MEKGKIKYWIIIAMFGLIASWVAASHINAGRDVTQGSAHQIDLPYVFGNWRGEDIRISEADLREIQDILGTDKIILRHYTNLEGDYIQLYIVFSQRDRTSFHPPEMCYLGAGSAELTSKRLVSLDLEGKPLDINRLVFQTPRSRQLVFYWYQAGKRMFASYVRQQAYLTWDILRNRPFKGFMVRLSTTDKESGADVPGYVADFIESIIPHLLRQA